MTTGLDGINEIHPRNDFGCIKYDQRAVLPVSWYYGRGQGKVGGIRMHIISPWNPYINSQTPNSDNYSVAVKHV